MKAAVELQSKIGNLKSKIIHPCRCLCLVFSHCTRTTPLRRITLHLLQIFLTDALTFTLAPLV
jgi:hypothetical protein